MVDAVLSVLCARAGIEPNWPRRAGGFSEDPTTHRANLRNLWNEALDAPAPSPVAPSGWGSGATTGYRDEPPF